MDWELMPEIITANAAERMDAKPGMFQGGDVE
jgi:hypothetical protein